MNRPTSKSTWPVTFERPAIGCDPASTDPKIGGRWVEIMEREQFENMSIDELWALYTDVDEILAARIVAKKQVLERRLAQLRQTVEPADSISEHA